MPPHPPLRVRFELSHTQPIPISGHLTDDTRNEATIVLRDGAIIDRYLVRALNDLLDVDLPHPRRPA